MTQPAKTAQEPSMEEILASIRRIIADDDTNKPAQRAPDPPKVEPPAAPPPPVFAPPPPPPPPAPPPRVEPEPRPMVLEQPNPLAESADILDLTESMAAAPPPPPPPEPSAPPPLFRTIDGRSDVGFAEAGERSPDDERRLISNVTSAAVDSAFNSLAQTVLMQNARTLEDLVREMLRPMLKTWLDDNLPGMVERLVRSEIERVSRGRPG